MSTNPVNPSGASGASGAASPAGRPGPAGPAGPPGLPRPIPSKKGVTEGVRKDPREVARRNIAYGSIFTFLALIAATLAGWLLDWIELADAEKMITTIASVLAGIVGAIIGFYFRSE